MKSNHYLVLIFLSLFFSCKKENDSFSDELVDFSRGYYISNEGSFGNNNASITHIGEDGTVTQDVYFNQNQVELGDVLQSFTIIDGKGYAVLNNSARVEVIQLSDMKNSATISGLSYPRYLLHGNNGKAYLTDGSFAGEVKVIDLATNSIESSIQVGNGPENMALSGNYLFVCNSGGWTIDNTVSVIDITTNSVVQTITTGDRPTDAIVDAHGDCWILCSGEIVYDSDWNITGHTDAMLYRLDGTTLDVEDAQIIGVSGDHPRQLDITPDGQTIYFENNGIYTLNINATDFDGTEIISENRNSLNIDPETGHIWCAGPTNFTDPSNVYEYDSNGTLIRTFEAGIGSNGTSFY